LIEKQNSEHYGYDLKLKLNLVGLNQILLQLTN